MADDPDFGVAAQPVPSAVCSHSRAVVTHPRGGHGSTHVQDVVRCTSGLGNAQYCAIDIHGSETYRGDYPAASDGHRDPHRACVAEGRALIGSGACVARRRDAIPGVTVLPLGTGRSVPKTRRVY